MLFAACSSTTTSDAAGDFHALGADLDRYLDPIALEDFLQSADGTATVDSFIASAQSDAVRGARAELIAWLDEDWPTEEIALPPEFAPELPAGEELLYFAPEMFEAGAEGFWSYAFSMNLEVPAPDAAVLEAWLELYYDGLLGAVARSAGMNFANDPATVSVRRMGPRDFTAELSVLDSFTDGARLELNARIHVAFAGERSCLLIVRVSPQPEGHAIWAELDAAAIVLSLSDVAEAITALANQVAPHLEGMLPE